MRPCASGSTVCLKAACFTPWISVSAFYGPGPAFAKKKARRASRVVDYGCCDFPFGEAAANDYILSKDQRNGEGLDGIFGIDG
jgi:hypothetical protein